jgi:hypothetical protein
LDAHQLEQRGLLGLLSLHWRLLEGGMTMPPRRRRSRNRFPVFSSEHFNRRAEERSLSAYGQSDARFLLENNEYQFYGLIY